MKASTAARARTASAAAARGGSSGDWPLMPGRSEDDILRDAVFAKLSSSCREAELTGRS